MSGMNIKQTIARILDGSPPVENIAKTPKGQPGEPGEKGSMYRAATQSGSLDTGEPDPVRPREKITWVETKSKPNPLDSHPLPSLEARRLIMAASGCVVDAPVMAQYRALGEKMDTLRSKERGLWPDRLQSSYAEHLASLQSDHDQDSYSRQEWIECAFRRRHVINHQMREVEAEIETLLAPYRDIFARQIHDLACDVQAREQSEWSKFGLPYQTSPLVLAILKTSRAIELNQASVLLPPK